MIFNHKRYEHLFFITLCVIGAFAILSSTMSKNPVLNPFAESLDTPETLMGVVAAASTLPGVLFSLPAGSLSDRLGRRKVLLGSSLVFASAPFLYLVITSWWHLILVRFYHGFATAIFVPVARAAIVDRYTAKRGERISTFTSATIVGRGIAPFLGGFILSITLWNYRMVYLVVSMVGLAVFLMTLLFLREQDTIPPTPLSDTASIPAPEHGDSESSSGWKDIFHNLDIVVVSSTEAAARYVCGALEFFLIGYLKNSAQLDPSLIGIIVGMQFIMTPILSPFLGRLSDRIGRKILILVGLTVSGLPLLIIPYVTSFLPLLAISLTYGLGFSMIISSTPALVSDLARKETYGLAMGFLATIMDVGQMLGPIITGLIVATFGYSGSFLSLGLILLGVSFFFSIYHKLLPRTQV
ncbi:MAG: MFS transporter [Candidatus Hermodarchaeia archaeon]